MRRYRESYDNIIASFVRDAKILNSGLDRPPRTRDDKLTIDEALDLGTTRTRDRPPVYVSPNPGNKRPEFNGYVQDGRPQVDMLAH